MMRRCLLGLVAVAGLATLAACDAGPHVSVTPDTGLVDGQTVTVSGGGYSPNSSLGIVQCPTGADSLDDCDGRTAHSFSADGAGNYVQPLTVQRIIRRSSIGEETDCSVPGNCVVASVYIHGFQGLATAPIQFAP
jgi:neocarzinostatin family protein